MSPPEYRCSSLRKAVHVDELHYHKKIDNPERLLIQVSFERASSIDQALSRSPASWRQYIADARTIIADLDTTSFISDLSRTSQQTSIIDILQRLAYSDPDNGSIADIATWCSNQWLLLLQRDRHNVLVLKGIGEAWLWKSQQALARIHGQERGSSSSSEGSGLVDHNSPNRPQEEGQVNVQAEAEREERLGTPDYVEARGLLQPASEYLNRALAAARAQSVVTGNLLAATAEAYMSLGNVSSNRFNERYYHQAIYLLRETADIPGYNLSTYLQQYLDDYGRLID